MQISSPEISVEENAQSRLTPRAEETTDLLNYVRVDPVQHQTLNENTKMNGTTKYKLTTYKTNSKTSKFGFPTHQKTPGKYLKPSCKSSIYFQ